MTVYIEAYLIGMGSLQSVPLAWSSHRNAHFVKLSGTLTRRIGHAHFARSSGTTPVFLGMHISPAGNYPSYWQCTYRQVGGYVLPAVLALDISPGGLGRIPVVLAVLAMHILPDTRPFEHAHFARCRHLPVVLAIDMSTGGHGDSESIC